MDAALASVLSVAVGGALAVSSTATVEFFKDRRERQRLEAEHEAQRGEASRKSYHELMSELQDSLGRMMDLAGELSLVLNEEDRARQSEELRRAEMECEKLISRLPDAQWRESVLEVVNMADDIRNSPDIEAIVDLLTPADAVYRAALDSLAVPLRDFYRRAALSIPMATRHPGLDDGGVENLAAAAAGRS